MEIWQSAGRDCLSTPHHSVNPPGQTLGISEIPYAVEPVQLLDLPTPTFRPDSTQVFWESLGFDNIEDVINAETERMRQSVLDTARRRGLDIHAALPVYVRGVDGSGLKERLDVARMPA